MRRAAVLVCLTAAGLAASAGGALAATPGATTGPATNVSSTSATVTGTVFPNKQKPTYHFQYGTTASYGNRTPDGGPVNGNAPKSVDAALTGLAPSTTYHYRLVVTYGGSNTVAGSDRTFKTLAPGQGPGVTIAATPRRVTFGNATTIAGKVSGHGASGARVELEQQPFPFDNPFQQLRAGSADTAGNYSFAGIAPGVNTNYRVRARTSPPATSPAIQVKVRPRVSLRVSDRTPRRGRRVRFHGHVKPAHDGRRVKIQRHTRKGWRTLARPVLKPAKPVKGVPRSRYSRRIRVRHSGRYRTLFPHDADHARGHSHKRRIRVH